MARGLTAVPDTQEAMRPSGEDGRAIQAPRAPDGETGPQRQAQFEVLPEQCQASHDAIRQPRGRGMARCAPGLLVGGEEADLPPDNLALERWCTQPKGHERRLHGHQHAGVRIVQAGPTWLVVLDAHLAHPEPFTGADGVPYRPHPAPAGQRQALRRRTMMRRARSKKQRPVLLAELERRYLDDS
jgi:hypothetical protein